MTTVGLLHYTCPPIVGGVESLMALHGRLLLERGYGVRALAGRGGRFHREVPLELIPALDSKHPPLLAVNRELRDGVVGPRFRALADRLVERLRAAFGGLDVCIVHNALSLHFNLPLTDALWRLAAEGGPRLVAWCHDLAWTNPLYIPLMREREPWSLLKTRLPGAAYVVVSEDRREDLERLWGQAPTSARFAVGEEPSPPPSPRGRGSYSSLSLWERAGGEGPPQSEQDAESLNPDTSDITVIPAGVDPAAKLRLRKATVQLADQLRLGAARPFILLPARITKRKNVEYAIRVTRALRDRGLRPLLLVTGPPGPHNVRSVDYVDELQAARRALDVGAEVRFLYEERRPDGRPWRASDAMMDDLYQLADLLLFPSAQEGFGIPLLEAGLVRLPVFCSDIPPFREIAGDAAHVFSLEDPPAAVAERIARFLATDRTARLRRRVLETYTWGRVFRERIEPLITASQPERTSGSAGGGGAPPPSRATTTPACERTMTAASLREYTILVPITDLGMAGRLIQVASALMPVQEGEARGKVITLGVVEIPEELAFSEGAVPARMHRQLLGRLRRRESPRIELRTLVRVHRQVWQGIVEAAQEERVDLILLGWSGRADTPHTVLGTTIDEAVRNAPCDIAITKGLNLGAAKRILVPIRGGPHAALAFKLATGLADHVDGTVTALRIEVPGAGDAEHARDAEEFAAVVATAPRPERVREVVVSAGDVVEAICKEGEGHQVVMMGAAAAPPEAGPAPDGTYALFGSIADTLAHRLERGMVIVKTKLPGTATHEEWERLFPVPVGRAEPRPDEISTVVDKWFAENTFDSRESERIDQLVRLKRQQGLTISLGLPALNEEETVGQIISAVKAELCDRHPLLDEIVLIDSRSTDRTRDIAEGLGIPVYVHQDILPRYGTYVGKGEALWKSLYVLKGDLIAWIDTDIKNIHPRFVYGLIGPLLKDRRIKFVKGFYKRPIRGPGGLQATGGGRVTELMARPLFNLFFPELSGIIQPLSGEQAGRREVLEQLPFFTGYGIETGLLIDLLEQFGLQAIGQVDLKRRVHRNQSLVSLSTMSFTILQIAMKRLEQRQRLQFFTEVSRSMKLIQHERDRFHVEVKALGDTERPPIATLREYQARGRWAVGRGQ